MDPEFGVGIGSKHGTGRQQRPRPSLFLRAMEMAGLALVAYGLGSYRFGHAAIGGLLIVGSYALYRRKHGSRPTAGPDGSPWGPDADGGGD